MRLAGRRPPGRDSMAVMKREEVTEYEITDADGHTEVFELTDRREMYSVEQRARDALGLGFRVRRRRLAVVEPWTDLPPG
jgi:hypothetical protein